MSQEETKNEMDAELLHALNDKFEVFTAQVLQKLDQLLELKTEVQKLSEGKRQQRDGAAERKRVQRARDREHRRRALLSIPNDIWRQDPRIKVKYLQWAHIGIQFGISGDWRLFLQHLAHDWNACTYLKKPIARCSNYPHWWDSGLRHENTWCDMFGSERGIVPKTAAEIKFWDFGNHVFAVVQRMETMPQWPNCPKNFVEAMQVAMGQMAGGTEGSPPFVVNGTEFDCRDAEAFEKVPEFRYQALHVMQAFKRGIIKGCDENLELIRLGKVSFLVHCKELEKEAAHMSFTYKLRHGKLTKEQRDHAEVLRDLGFFEYPAVQAEAPKEVAVKVV